jgi:hypothetical protein
MKGEQGDTGFRVGDRVEVSPPYLHGCGYVKDVSTVGEQALVTVDLDKRGWVRIYTDNLTRVA